MLGLRYEKETIRSSTWTSCFIFITTQTGFENISTTGPIKVFLDLEHAPGKGVSAGYEISNVGWSSVIIFLSNIKHALVLLLTQWNRQHFSFGDSLIKEHLLDVHEPYLMRIPHTSTHRLECMMVELYNVNIQPLYSSYGAYACCSRGRIS